MPRDAMSWPDVGHVRLRVGPRGLRFICDRPAPPPAPRARIARLGARSRASRGPAAPRALRPRARCILRLRPLGGRVRAPVPAASPCVCVVHPLGNLSIIRRVWTQSSAS